MTKTPADRNGLVELTAALEAFTTVSIATSGEHGLWIMNAFFVHDYLEDRLDICCALITSSRPLVDIRTNPGVAFLIGESSPKRWVQGTGVAEHIESDADAAEIGTALSLKVPDAITFLGLAPWRAVRIHVDHLRLSDMRAWPPVGFTFPVRARPM